MLHSMTGFGSASGEVDNVRYAVEVRSVNNRYLKTNIKLPESCLAIEPRIEQILKKHIQRGTVSVSVRMKIAEDAAAHQVNRTALDGYLSQLRDVGRDHDGLTVDLSGLLLLPGVCEPPSLEDVIRETAEDLLVLVEQAVEGLVEMRRREGAALQEHLTQLCDEIDAELETVTGRAPLVVQDYHERLTSRVRELVEQGRAGIDEETLAREVAIFAERSDIAEELSRLTGHVEQFREACRCGGLVGRKLDFIAQEMLREANTIAAKANDTRIARAVVNIKTAIDRIKEQVQNAE